MSWALSSFSQDCPVPSGGTRIDGMCTSPNVVCLIASLSHRSSFFLIGFYTFSLACLALILKFGVLEAINPPDEKLRGVFVLACCIAGIGGGGVAIFFWRQAKYFVGAWGGFALGLWVQCFRAGGLLRAVGFRWILYIGTS